MSARSTYLSNPSLIPLTIEHVYVIMRMYGDHAKQSEKDGHMKNDVKKQIEEFIENNKDNSEKFQEYKGYDTYMRNKRIIDNSDLPKEYIGGRLFTSK